MRIERKNKTSGIFLYPHAGQVFNFLFTFSIFHRRSWALRVRQFGSLMKKANKAACHLSFSVGAKSRKKHPCFYPKVSLKQTLRFTLS